MPKSHTIEAGQGTESVAYDHGFFWQTVWEFGANSGLRQNRPDPNILEEGDVLVVPDKRAKSEAGATNNRHRFRRKGVPSVLRVRLLDQHKPRVDLGYSVAFGDKQIKGRTDDDGWIRCFLMPDVTQGVLTLETGEVYRFDVGTVRPVKSLRGVQNRLRNLGYYWGPIDGQMNDELRDGLSHYQAKQELPVTGEADAATIAALRSGHQS